MCCRSKSVIVIYNMGHLRVNERERIHKDLNFNCIRNNTYVISTLILRVNIKTHLENKYYVSCLSWPPIVSFSFSSSSIHISNSSVHSFTHRLYFFLLNCRKMLLALIFMSADPNRKEHQPMPESRSSIKRLHLFYTMFVGI